MTDPIPRKPSRPLQYLKAVANSDPPTGTRAVCWALASSRRHKGHRTAHWRHLLRPPVFRSR